MDFKAIMGELLDEAEVHDEDLMCPCGCGRQVSRVPRAYP